MLRCSEKKGVRFALNKRVNDNDNDDDGDKALAFFFNIFIGV